MQLEELLEHFHITSWGVSRWQAKCPAHEDTKASLSLSDGEDRLLVKCQAMCLTSDVVRLAGLHFRDLFYDQSGAPDMSEPEAVYEYTDENGNYLFEMVRFPGKVIRARTKEGWGIGGTRRVLFNLPELIQGKHKVFHDPRGTYRIPNTIYIVEGEKDVLALRDRGVLATCPPFGAGKWKASYVKYFKDADVIVVADRDAAGYKHAEEIRESLEGIAKSVRVVQAKEGKDVSDHLEAGHTVEDLEPVNALTRT